MERREFATLVTPSSYQRTMECPSWVGLFRDLDFKNYSDSSVAERGRYLHKLAEDLLQSSDKTTDEELVAGYVEFIAKVEKELDKKYRVVDRLIEARLPVGNGSTGQLDFAAVAKTEAGFMGVIVDLKTGFNPVKATNNAQALGYMLALDGYVVAKFGAGCTKMAFFIYQFGGFDKWIVDRTEFLRGFAEVSKAVDKAKEIYESREYQFKTGEWCKYCPCLSRCPGWSMEVAKVEIQSVEALQDSELVQIWSRKKDLEKFLEAVEKELVRKVQEGGVAGVKLVQGRGRRVWANEDAVVATFNALGFDPYKKSLVGVPEGDKILGKERMKDLVVYKSGAMHLELSDANNLSEEFTEI